MLPETFSKLLPFREMGTASKEEVWCKEATVKEVDGIKKKKNQTAFEGRHSAISYTAKVNLEKKVEILSYYLSGFNTLGHHKAYFSIRPGAELFLIFTIFTELFLLLYEITVLSGNLLFFNGYEDLVLSFLRQFFLSLRSNLSFEYKKNPKPNKKIGYSDFTIQKPKKIVQYVNATASPWSILDVQQHFLPIKQYTNLPWSH